jgi:hypothetical protein
VADLRAPTPSAAAELAVFDYARFAADLEARKRKLSREMGFFLDKVKGRLRQDELKIRLYHPQHVIREKRQRLADHGWNGSWTPAPGRAGHGSRPGKNVSPAPWTGGWKTTKKDWQRPAAGSGGFLL